MFVHQLKTYTLNPKYITEFWFNQFDCGLIAHTLFYSSVNMHYTDFQLITLVYSCSIHQWTCITPIFKLITLVSVNSIDRNVLCIFRPTISFLAGRNSVYHGIPRQVLASAFNVEQGTLKQLGRDEEVIFPPPSKSTRRDTRREGERERTEEEQERRHRRHRHSEDHDDDEEEESYWLEQTLASLL